MDIAKRLTQLMNERKLSEYRLSKESGVSQSTLSGILRGNALPSLPTLELLSNYFGMTTAQFLSDPDTEAFYPLSSREKELIEKWHMLPERQQNSILQLIESML